MNEPKRPESPYIGLIPYSENDAAFFFGRKTEEQIIIANLRASRLTLLYGPSGVGKSSVLRAGVIHHLRELAHKELIEYGAPGFAIAIIDSWADDPVTAIVSGVKKAISEALQISLDEAAPDNRDLTDFFKQWSERSGLEFLIILDQFEEYLMYHRTESGEGTFADQLPKVIYNTNLPVRFLISLREDALSKLDKFKSTIPTLFDNRLQIKHLDLESAREAIEKPVEAYSKLLGKDEAAYSIESALVDEVLKQVQTGQILFAGTGRGEVKNSESDMYVESPYLQLVMTRIWQEEVKAKSRTLRKETLTKLGGAEKIVQMHLDSVMKTLSSAEKKAASACFKYLVTPSGTKVAQAVSSLVAFTKFSEDRLKSMLEKLSSKQSVILRSIMFRAGNKEEPGYEIFHDALAAAILDWRTRYKESVLNQRLSVIFAIAFFALVAVPAFYNFYSEGTAKERLTIVEAQAQQAQAQADQATIEASEAKEQTDIALEEEWQCSVLLSTLVELKSQDASRRRQAVTRLEELAKQNAIPQEAKPLVEELVAESAPQLVQQTREILAQIDPKKTVIQNYEKLPPRVYIHIQDESQRDKARAVEKVLEANGFIVPGIQKVASSRQQTDELRYFQTENGEEDSARKIVELIGDAGIKGVKPRFFALSGPSVRMRPRHFELWFKSDSPLGEITAPVQQMKPFQKARSN